MARRFFVPHPLDVPRLLLSGGEAHHLLHVLRLTIGDKVVLFDGVGNEATARIESISADSAELTILETRSGTAENVVPVILGTAVPKGDRFSWLVEKATELGVSRLIPLNTQRSIVDPGEGKLSKMRQTVVAASKQCGRTRLMEIDPPITWRKFVEQEFPQGNALVAHPSGERLCIPVDEPVRPIILAIGPEGGLTDAELELALEHGARLVSLGPRILRVETAGLALAALMST